MTDPDLIEKEFRDFGNIRPTWRAWLLHIGLLLLTLCTATIAGVIYPFGTQGIFPDDDPQSFQEVLSFIASLPMRYVDFIFGLLQKLSTDHVLLMDGLSFSVSLLFILTSHEMGHYIACRLYKVDSTLPFFIPTPPLIGPAGTFGAFIKIRSPLPSPRAIFDIGVAGPIAGFIALIPIAVIGIATMQPASPVQIINEQAPIVFSDPLLLKAIALCFGKDLNFGVGNPFYYAAWVGLLVTALNLIPSGQLDGGHAMYAVLGKRIHHWTGRIAFVAMAAFAIVGWFLYSSPSGFLIAILLGVMMRVGHPEPYDQTPLDAKRKLIAVATLVIFILCFVPFPIQIS
ncbi:MAG: site-2 protease family protein [Candidatus Binatia bacterium]